MGSSADLEVRNLTVRFGGATAVNDLSLRAPTASITSLIGPNGAGKTTTFNACSGLLRPTTGTITFGGVDMAHRGPEHRARLGLGRTFQRMELFESLTVLENVALGREARLSANAPWRHLISARHEAKEVEERTLEAIQLCGLSGHASYEVGGLSTGRRRLVELARVICGGFVLLLLDEPSSGLDHHETAAFGAILRRLVSERRLGILLVEHDMSLVMSVSEYIYVLDFGSLIFEGLPAEAQNSATVREAYLGTNA